MNRRTIPAALVASALLALAWAPAASTASATGPTGPSLSNSSIQDARTPTACKPKKKGKKAKKSRVCRPGLTVTSPTPATTPPSTPDPAASAEPDATVPLPAAGTKGQPKTPTGYVPGGSPSSFAVMTVDENGRAGHWDYCKPIQYKINPTGMTQDWLSDIRTAFAKLSDATGLQFIDGGPTDVITLNSPNWYESLTEENIVYVAMTDATQVPRLAGSVAGIGGPAWAIEPTGREARMYVGAVMLDREADLAPGFGPRSRGQLLLHELGHVVGLGHVNDPSQMMNPYLTIASPTEFQAGDLSGFNQLASYDCF